MRLSKSSTADKCSLRTYCVLTHQTFRKKIDGTKVKILRRKLKMIPKMLMTITKLPNLAANSTKEPKLFIEIPFLLKDMCLWGMLNVLIMSIQQDLKVKDVKIILLSETDQVPKSRWEVEKIDLVGCLKIIQFRPYEPKVLQKCRQ